MYLSQTYRLTSHSPLEDASQQSMTGPLLTDSPRDVLPEQIQREVKWVKVAEKWTRMSIMTKILNIPREQREENSAERTNFLMVPGNSGNEGYYEQFGRELLVRLGPKHGDVYFYTVSHLNHVDMPRSLRRTGKNKPSDRFSLADQIQHKKDFCTEYLPKDGRLFVFGHSISCYIALKILPFLLENGWELVKMYALFPAIERLQETPNGARLKPIASFKKNHDRLTKILYSWLKITPFCVKRCIVKCCLRFYGKPPECIIRSGAEVLSINAIRNVAFITTCEMEESHRELSFDTSLAIGGGQKPEIPRNALRLKISAACGPISKIFVPFVLAHRELSFDTSLAFGSGQDRQISTNALRAHNSVVGGPISNLTIFPSMAHREESFDVSHASGRMLDISKQYPRSGKKLAHFDESLLSEHKEHIQFYYGTDDAWIVPEVVEDMRRRLPGQVAVDKHGCHHAFVMNHNEIMAKVVVEMVDCATCAVDEKEDPITTRMRSPFSTFSSWLF
ncbi:lipid-droplet associated hydrolase domain-containing protein [Ditylenchus destructor]|uniref:Lipid droplet-associated hydrolase n=1 Tax=Ditylenchus destructor TaxID=166010 RepID=A0AAD4QTK5_9BILA|nr:lipid-droplet associated hydrolase domain-containing protein [Ditylenchus destructor]